MKQKTMEELESLAWDAGRRHEPLLLLLRAMVDEIEMTRWKIEDLQKQIDELEEDK